MASLPPSSKSPEEVVQESKYERLTRKFRQEPLVPVGLVATCAALFGASVAIRKGNQNSANKYFRWRIYAQGFTVVAMVAGSVFYGEARAEEKQKKQEAERLKSQQARERWLADLDAYEEERKAQIARREARKQARQAREQQS
ncbi:hypothetical protein PYCC9005_000362 [Savitreella phatthalungensis]